MASTSDSEDFESADEGGHEETVCRDKRSHKEHVGSKADKVIILKEGTSISNTPPVILSTEISRSDISPDGKTESKAEFASIIAHTPTDEEPPIERRRKQQKPSESKPSGASKKLGKKITALPEPDPYEKFRGFSEPPEMESCWEMGVDDKDVHAKICDAATAVDDTIEPSGSNLSNPDPYAQFKGYSKLPVMQRCFEIGKDGKAVLDDHEAKMLSREEPKQITPNSQTTASGESEQLVKENLNPLLDKLSESAADKTPASSWGGWGNWDVTSILSSATESVSTLLESTIGIPPPEDLARNNQMQENAIEREPEKCEEEVASGRFGFGQLMKLVETTSNKVITGGLDTLETIGKKTMEVLQEGDPGLKKKRAMFTDKTVLSQILREAKEKAELDDKAIEDQQAKRNIHFETLFDDFQGLVHLEALEMLSKQCDMKIQSYLLAISGKKLLDMQGDLKEIKDLCQLPDDDDCEDTEDVGIESWQEKLGIAEKELGVPIATNKLHCIWEETTDWLKNSDTQSQTTQEIHLTAVSTLAKLTAVSVEQFHKGAELLLVKETRNPSEEARALITITMVLCSQVSSSASRFCQHLNDAKESLNNNDVNPLITNIFLEASNSSSYIQEAFQLLVPVLQVGLMM